MSITCAKIVLVLCMVLVYCAFQRLVHNINNNSNDINLAKVKPRGYIRQNGEFWVWNNYLIADEVFIGNESVTLATHASYQDLGFLPDLLIRWRGPISISIFVCGTDFEKTIDSLRYIYTCLNMRYFMKRYLTIHLIIHDQHFPENLKSMKMHDLDYYKQCKFPVFQNTTWTQSYWRRRKLTYPRNLLRNVARINIYTYYVLSIDIHMSPTPNFPKKFLKFVWNHDTWRFADIPKPYTSVFCLPVFPLDIWDFIPKDKLQLRKLQVSRLSRRQKRWLDAPNPHDEVFIYKISKKADFCVAYVSINELEPLYDEQDENGSILEQDTNLKSQLLVDLKYNFIVLDGVFLIEHILWRNWTIWNSRRRKKRALKSIRRRYIWHSFYTKVISLVPDEFAQLWYTRSRSSWQRRSKDG